MSSYIWKHFKKISQKPLAKCIICENVYSYKTSITNLKKHLSHKHKSAYQNFSNSDQNRVTVITTPIEYQQESVSKDENSDDEESSSPYWSFFERDGKGRARCAVCCAKVYSHASALSSHLKTKHPKLVAEMSPQGSEHQNADEEEIYTDVIYLEEDVKDSFSIKEKKDKKETLFSFKSQPSTSRYSSRKRSISQSSEEIVYKKKRNTSDRRQTVDSRQTSSSKKGTDGEDTEIEMFGSYVICLLKKLPRHVRLTLQRDIINLIMNANLNEESNEAPNKIVLDGSKIYMMSKTDGTSNTISEGTATLENHSYDMKVVTENDNTEKQDSDA